MLKQPLRVKACYGSDRIGTEITIESLPLL
jgi:hypothetical protein